MKLYAVHLASGKTYCKNNYLFLSPWKVKVILISIPPPLFWPILKNLNEGIGVELGWKHMMWVVGDGSTWCKCIKLYNSVMAILEPITHKYFQLDFQLQIQKSYMEEILKKKKYRPLTSCASITDHSHHVLPSPTTHIMCFHHRPLTSCASIPTPPLSLHSNFLE
jgi:hypothetical protein